MAKLSTKSRKRLPDSAFAIPEKRAYPCHDKPHAQNAKARAQQQYDAGKLSAKDKARVDRKANSVLRAKGAKTIEGKPVKRKPRRAKP